MSNNKQSMKLYTEEEVCSILRLFIEDTRGDKPWVDADDEWLQQFLKQKTMSNNKQSSVEWLIDKCACADLRPELWNIIKQQAKAMHKEEMVDFTTDWHHNGLLSLGVLVSTSVEEHYNKTFKQ